MILIPGMRQNAQAVIHDPLPAASETNRNEYASVLEAPFLYLFFDFSDSIIQRLGHKSSADVGKMAKRGRMSIGIRRIENKRHQTYTRD